MKRLLVTGASGLLGLNLIQQARERYTMVGVLRKERLSAQSCSLFQPVYADLSQPGVIGPILDRVEPDAVIHCAAMTDVDFCQSHLDDAALINAYIPGVLAQEVNKRNIPLLHVSTDSVFDGTRGNYCEEDLPNPINVYARTKLDGEFRVFDAYPAALVVRVNFFGWSWQGYRSLAEWFFNRLSRGIAVSGFINLHFCPMHVNQLADILFEMLEKGLRGLYHVVSSEAQSKFAFGKMIARQFGFDEALISPYNFRNGDLKAPRPLNLTLSCEKLSLALGHSLPGQKESLQNFYNLYCQGYPGLLRTMFEQTAEAATDNASD